MLLSFFILTISIPCFAQNIKQDLIGKWQGTSAIGKIITLNFIDSTNIIFVFDSSDDLNLNYRIIPGITNRIIFKTPEASGNFEFSGLFKNISKTEMKLQVFEDKNEIADFMEGNKKYDPPIIFTRIK